MATRTLRSQRRRRRSRGLLKICFHVSSRTSFPFASLSPYGLMQGEDFRHVCDSRRNKQGPYGKIDVKDVDYPGYELHGAKGVTAKLQEGVMNADLINAQDLRPKPCQPHLIGVSWSDKRDMQSRPQ